VFDALSRAHIWWDGQAGAPRARRHSLGSLWRSRVRDGPPAAGLDPRRRPLRRRGSELPWVEGGSANRTRRRA
jgi:hypothetical protein